MENTSNNPFYSKKVQDILNKLISEEMLANETYRGACMVCKLEDAVKLSKPFQTIADDELGDHHRALVTFAACNDYKVPFQEKDYKKYASEVSWKSYDGMKRDADMMYYIDLMIKGEEDAIKSYEEALKVDDVPYELYAILQKNYYDECQHLDDLHTLKIAAEAGADLAWTNAYEGNQPEYSCIWPWSCTYGGYCL